MKILPQSTKQLIIALFLFVGNVAIGQNQADSLNNLAIKLKQKGNYEMAINLHKKALAIRLKTKNWDKASDSYNNIATIWVFKNHSEVWPLFERNPPFSHLKN